MKIQSVRIKNFRALTDVSIPFDSVTTFIGPNGAGKSTVLRALDWFFNGKVGTLNEKDCSFGTIDKDIEVQVTFSNLTERDREALGKYAPQKLQHSLHGGCARPTVQKDSLPTRKASLILTILKLQMEQQRRRICTTLFEKHTLNSIFLLPRQGLLSKKQ